MEQTSNFASFAKEELDRSGWMTEESDYSGMVGEAVLELCEVLSKQGHSGMSAALTVELFDCLAEWKPLSPITDSPDEWMVIEEERQPPGAPKLWQSRRSPGCFSTDGGHTYYDIDEKQSWPRRKLMDWFHVYRPKMHYSLPMERSSKDG